MFCYVINVYTNIKCLDFQPIYYFRYLHCYYENVMNVNCSAQHRAQDTKADMTTIMEI